MVGSWASLNPPPAVSLPRVESGHCGGCWAGEGLRTAVLLLSSPGEDPQEGWGDVGAREPSPGLRSLGD